MTPPKSKYGRSTMFMLARCYLDAAGIEIAPGEKYDASKIARGLSAILKDCKGDADEAMRRIREAGEYYNSKGLPWTPIAVWRSWEMIQTWKTQAKKTDNSILL